MTRRRGVRALAALLSLVLVSACADGEERRPRSGPAASAPVMGGTLVDLQNFPSGDPDHIDPALAATVQAAQPGHLLFDGLTESDPRTGEPREAVAQSWEHNPELTVWTFRLRPGVTFSNGDPVLPSDFKFAWERLVSRALASPLSFHVTQSLRVVGAREVAEGTATEIRGLRADDSARTLTVELEQPLSFVPSIVSHLALSPVPKNVVRDLPDQSRWDQGIMVGNGPYKMAEPWKHDRFIKLVRNDRYWGGVNGHAPYIEKIQFSISKDVASAFDAFQAGEGQTAYIPPGRAAEVKKQNPGRVSDPPLAGVYFWAFNMQDPVVGGPDNRDLRRAIALAIDRKKIVDFVYNGTRVAATAWTPPLVPGYREGVADVVGRDLPRAKEALAAWERESGKKAAALQPLRLNFAAGGGHDAVATIIQDNLSDLGIRSVLEPGDAKTYFSDMRQGRGQFLWAAWVADYDVYDNMLFPVFASSQVGAGDNLAQYRSAPFDSLMDQARRAASPEARNRLYQEAEATVLNRDVAVVPLNWYAGQVVWSPDLNNVMQSPLAFLAYEEMWLSP